jgi:hypothetical protein
VPGAGNSQAWNRYSYVLNRPTISADPSGHMTCNVMVSGSAPVDEDACEAAQRNRNPDFVGPLDYQQPGLPVHVHRQGNGLGSTHPEIVIPEVVDDWLYENIPSVIGNQVGISGQVGMGLLEGGTVPLEVGYLFNWRTGEITITKSADVFGYTGSPSLFGGNVYVGATYIYGISDNRFLEGPALFTGATGSLDMIAKGGFSAVKGTYFEPDMTPDHLVPFVDPGSGQTGTYYQASITYGGNLMPNGIDGGFMYGFAGTQIIGTYQIPWYPRITSNK